MFINLKYVHFKLCGILWTFYSPKSLPIRINDCLIILRFSINQKTIVVKYCQLNFILSLFFCAYMHHIEFFYVFHMKIQNYVYMHFVTFGITQPMSHSTNNFFESYLGLPCIYCILCKIQTQIHKNDIQRVGGTYAIVQLDRYIPHPLFSYSAF